MSNCETGACQICTRFQIHALPATPTVLPSLFLLQHPPTATAIATHTTTTLLPAAAAHNGALAHRTLSTRPRRVRRDQPISPTPSRWWTPRGRRELDQDCRATLPLLALQKLQSPLIIIITLLRPLFELLRAPLLLPLHLVWNQLGHTTLVVFEISVRSSRPPSTQRPPKPAPHETRHLPTRQERGPPRPQALRHSPLLPRKWLHSRLWRRLPSPELAAGTN